MVSGAGLLFFFVAFWYWAAGLRGVLLIQVVTNVTFSGTEFSVTVKPAKIIQFGFLFFCHVRHPSGSEPEQMEYFRQSYQAVRIVGFVVAPTAADAARAD